MSYPVRVAARMTGLKPELIRAWETRYEAVRPRRTLGGSRRYSLSDLERLRLLRDVVGTGRRIGAVARLDLVELRSLLPATSDSDDTVDRVLTAAIRLDAIELRRLLLTSILDLGRVGFARKLAVPLLVEIGQRWERGEFGVSSEHFATGILRSILLSMLEAGDARQGLPTAVFATPSGEPHDAGTLIAALVASQAGADVAFLGADVPTRDLVDCVTRSKVSVLVLGLVTLPKTRSEDLLRDLRERLAASFQVWIGGAGIAGLAPIKGIERIENLDQLEARFTLLDLGGVSHPMALPPHESEARDESP